MAASLKTNIDEWISKLLDYPGCDNKTLIIRKTIWIHSVGSLIAILALTFGFIFFVPQLTILIYYGVILLSILIPVLILSPFLRKKYNHLIIINLTLMIIVSFIFVIKLGGITSSAGLIFVGLSAVLSSIPLQNAKITLSLFSIYMLTILLAGLAEPWLTVPEQLTPEINSVIFLINTLWMSAYLLSIVLNFIEQQRLNDQLETKKLKEINEAKTKLFTNITHEFRTPLTIIQGMTDLIQKQPQEWLKEGTQKIRNNSFILLRLINQMLDIAKIETGAMSVHMKQADIVSFLGYLTELFISVSHERKVKLSFSPDKSPVVMDFDPDKLVHIVSNLLANAFKFTPDGGSIEVKTILSPNEDVFTIQVSDTGKGIHHDHLLHIFDRFYQVENSSGSAGGSGLGLALSKEMVEMLKGQITVESQPGKGTTFYVSLPVSRNAAMSGNENFTELLSDQINTAVTGLKVQKSSSAKINPPAPDLPTLIIVEDSSDVSQYLEAILKHEYQIELAENGKAGLEKTLSLIPDIVLSDVMMPEMDGIEMLGKIKNDFRTSHIPVVLLTAKADIDSRLAGLERGADAYIAKPFNENELHIQLKNLVEQRKKLHERYASFAKFPETNDLAIKAEDAFMIKVRGILDKNIDNEDFDINDLCQELAVSHAQFYRKFKSISNQTIADYFKLLRLNRAKELLAKPELNITQIAFSVGFKNLSHFSREFAQHFGKSPTELRKQ
jgi:signal transduction histidine kinase/DNA-binding response OmpR family regulator